MKIRLNAQERAVAHTALAQIEKALETIEPKLQELGLSTMQANTQLGRIQECRTALHAALEKKRTAEGVIPADAIADVEFTADLQSALTTGLWFYHNKLVKVAEAQGKLDVMPEDTNEREAAVMALVQRLHGQESLFEPLGIAATSSTTQTAEQAAEVAATIAGGDKPVPSATVLTDRSVARETIRRAKKKAHPDAGGTAEQFARVNVAEAVLTAHHGGAL